MSQFVKGGLLAPEDIREGQSRIRIELMKLRAALTRDDEGDKMKAFAWNRAEYDSPQAYLSEIYRPNPARRVAASWKRLEIDKQGPLCFEGSEIEGVTVVEGVDGPLKVRWLRGPKAGAVEDLSVLAYHSARATAFGCRGMLPVCEPCEDDEPLCPAAKPPGMPSSLAKARRIAAHALRKSCDEITFDEVVQFYRSGGGAPARDQFH
jgi:hypothetical protein